MPLDRPESAVQVTRFTRNPVRFLSMAGNGMLSFGYDGELYTLAPGASEPVKVAVRIAADTRDSRIENSKLSQGATEIATSPDGQEIAFVLRGEIFVASSEFGDTRRITDLPALKRSVSFSPDGRRLLFAGEKDGSWNLYEASLPASKRDAPYFFAASRIEVKTLLKNAQENFQPRYSPDGKEVAFLENRSTLKVLNLASRQTRLVLPGNLNYSYEDGDQWFDWAPDSRSLLVTFNDPNRWSSEAGLIDAQGKGPLLNLTKSGYEDNHPIWSRNGQTMTWLSDRMGLHGNGSGASTQQDVFEMFFTREALDRFRLNKGEFALLKKQEEDDKKVKEREAAKAKGRQPPAARGGGAQVQVANAAAPDDAASKPPPEPVRIEPEDLENRVARLTANSGDIKAWAMTPDGETLFTLQETAGSVELWSNHIRDKEVKRVAGFPVGAAGRSEAQPIDLLLDAKGENGFVLAGGAIQKFKVPKDPKAELKPEPLHFSAEMQLDRAAERAQMFDHVWRQTRDKLYLKNMNGVDWAYYRQVYAKFLPFVVDNHDFAELLSEMLGELNVSHTGAGYRPRTPGADATAALGAFFDDAYAGAGLKLAEIIEDGPLVGARSTIRAGMVIEKIDGTPIAAGAEVDSLLNQRAGKRLELSVFDPATGKRFEETVKPISLGEQGELLYKRWVKSERERVDKLSGGRLGYVHVRGMDDRSYRDVFSEILGRDSGKQALIVDTRFNGGGNLHDELATLLNGKPYLESMPRGQSLGWEPASKWTKPSLVLISESNYSDAHLFPWVYRHLGIGKLLGMPVAGTGTAVWWETLQDSTLYFGIPQVGFRDAQGDFMETALIEPDIEVPMDPALLGAGRDQQIEAAVRELLKN